MSNCANLKKLKNGLMNIYQILLVYKDGNKNNYITWFKTNTIEHMIEKLIFLMKISEKYNVPCDIIYTNYVGKIVYEDKYQVAVE